VTASEFLSSLEVALGGVVPAPKVHSHAKLAELLVTAENFEKLLRHWISLPVEARPRLRGLTLSREARPARQLLLELGPRTPLLLITVDASWPARTLAGVWPYARWFEDELTSTGTPAAAGAGKAEVEWRHA
jgi:hypothetical protein